MMKNFDSQRSDTAVDRCDLGKLTSEPKAETSLRGVFPILATPYDRHGVVDYEDLVREVEFVARCGVSGMAWPQLAGDTFNLTQSERLRGMDVLAQATRGKPVALILGVDGPNLKSAMQYLEYANSLNPEALIALPPYEARSMADVLDYYRALACATPKPLFIQNSDLHNGVKPDIASLVQLAREYPNCGYFKEEIPPALERNQELCRHRPVVKRIFSGGGGRTLLEEMRLGVDGVMAGNAYADLLLRIWELFHSGQEARASELHATLVSLLELETEIPLARRYIFKRRGVFKTETGRKEKGELTQQEIRKLERTFGALVPHLSVAGTLSGHLIQDNHFATNNSPKK